MQEQAITHRHPKALPILTLTEMWDRFNYYGIQALLVLFLTKSVGFSDANAYGIYGVYVSLAFAVPVICGFLADKVLGARQAIILGSILIILGNLVLISTWQHSLFVGLSTLVIGTGFLKPSCVTLTGMLYASGDKRRETGFTFFYMGMNSGAMLGPFIYGLVTHNNHWYHGFWVSAIIMTINLCFFLKNTQCLPATASLPKKRSSLATVVFYSVLLLFIALISLLFKFPDALGSILSLFALLILSGLLVIIAKSNRTEARHIIALTLLITLTIAYFIASLQITSSLTLFIERYIDKSVAGITIPTILFASLEPFFIICLTPFLAVLWKYLNAKQREPFMSQKIGLGLFCAALSFLTFAFAVHWQAHQWLSLLSIILGNILLGLGELVMMPALMSAITEYAPKKLKSTFVGILFLSLSFAGYLSSLLAKFTIPPSTKNLSLKTLDSLYFHTFLGIALSMLIFSLAAFLISPAIKKLFN